MSKVTQGHSLWKKSENIGGSGLEVELMEYTTL